MIALSALSRGDSDPGLCLESANGLTLEQASVTDPGSSSEGAAKLSSDIYGHAPSITVAAIGYGLRR